MLLLGLGEIAETVEKHGASKGAHNQELHVQVHQSVCDCLYTEVLTRKSAPHLLELFLVVGMSYVPFALGLLKLYWRVKNRKKPFSSLSHSSWRLFTSFIRYVVRSPSQVSTFCF